MAPLLRLKYGDQQASVAAGAVGTVRKLQETKAVIKRELNLTEDEYELYDAHGLIENDTDLQRAFHKFNKGEDDCELEVKNSWEHNHFMRIRMVENTCTGLDERIKVLETKTGDTKLQNKVEDLQRMIEALEQRMTTEEQKVINEVEPVLVDLQQSRDTTQKDIRMIQEKLGTFNFEDIKETTTKAMDSLAEVQASILRVNQIDAMYSADKAKWTADNEKMQQDLLDLQRYMQGKIDVVIQCDANLAREIQLSNEHMQLLADDIRLLKDEHSRLSRQCTDAVEENDELRTLVGQVREDTEHQRYDCGMMQARLHCLEGQATQQWDGFWPGVLYFRLWHRGAKGGDVKLSSDLKIATGRGFSAAFGVVIGCDEGLAVADGPCRRFGTPGNFSSYFEIEVDEIQTAPANAGGLYVGVSLQNGEEISQHPKHEFDGWLLGGPGKALSCRAGTGDSTIDPDKLPATYAPNTAVDAQDNAKEALRLLRQALPPKPQGSVKEVEGLFNSQGLKMGDRVGVLFRCNRHGGARMKVTVNGDVVATHEFVEAPVAEAVGFLTPVIRLAGTGKSAKLLPGLMPPSRLLVD